MNEAVTNRWPNAAVEKHVEPGAGSAAYYVVWNEPASPDGGRILLGMGRTLNEAWTNAAKTVREIC